MRSQVRKLVRTGPLAASMVLMLLLAACSDGSGDVAETDDGTGTDTGTAAEEDGDGGSGDGEMTSLIITPASPSFTSQAYYYIADHLGYYEEENLDVEVLSSFEGGQPEVALLEGELDFVAGSPTNFFDRLAEDADTPMTCVATMGLWPFRVMVLPDSPLETPEDLAGAVIGVPEQSDVGTLEYMLSVAGVDSSGIETPAVGGRAPAAVELAAGRIDAFMGSHIDKLAMQTQGDTDVREIDTVPTSSTFNTCMLTRPETIDDQPEVVEGLLRALAKGFAIQNEEPELAIDLLGEARPEAYDDTEEGREDALASMQATNSVNGGTYDEQWEYPVDEWQTMVESYVEAGSLESSFDIANHLNFSFLNDAWDFDTAEVIEGARGMLE